MSMEIPEDLKSMYEHFNALKDCDGECSIDAVSVTSLIEEVAALRARLEEIRGKALCLLDGMDTCHICKGKLIIEETPSHCEDCSYDCEDHEEPNCLPLYYLHRELRRAINPPSEALPEGKHETKQA